MELTIEECRALGGLLRIRRKNIGLTQKALAKLSHVAERSIQHAESGDCVGAYNLGLLAKALGTTKQEILQEAQAHRAPAPDLRVALKEMTSGDELLRSLGRQRGALQTAPEGEHGYNEQIAPLILEVAEAASAKKRVSRAAKQQAEYIVGFTSKVGFRLFAGQYRAHLEHRGKAIPQATTVVLAAPATDGRIHKTLKGLVLDYHVDSRRNVLQRALNEDLTIYDWMEEQRISRSDGEPRARAALLRIRREVIAQAKKMKSI
jgi:transcriptional regulator with XRE-family HTH domain